MNIAILIGVSEYADSRSNLPGCQNDLNLMKSLVDATKKYDDILVIDQDTDSANVKEKLASFFEKYQNKQNEVNETFFYYSGHGQYYQDEFYFQLSDFKSDRRKTTSLENSELDNWLRGINSDLTIKIVDACQSGVSYVKDIGDPDFKKYLNSTQSAFKNCYFMYSSHSNQSSGMIGLSFFTESLVRGVLEQKTETNVRYKSIMDYISDDFEKYTDQTPFFVMQANNTESFCILSSEMKQIVSSEFQKYASNMPTIPKESSNNFIDIVKMDAKDYIRSMDDFLERLNGIIDTVENYQYDNVITEIFDVSFTFENEYQGLPKFGVLAKSLEKQEDDYFIELKYVQKEAEVPDPPFGLSMFNLGIYKPKQVLVGFDLTVQVPVKVIKIVINPKEEFPNLNRFICEITYIFSKVNINLLYYYGRFKNKGFDGFELLNDEVKWMGRKSKIINTEEIKMNVKLIMDDFQKYVIEKLEDQFKELIPSIENGGDSQDTSDAEV